MQGAGYTASIHRLDEIGPLTRSQLERISSAWRDGAPERGFSMAMDSLGGEHQADSVVVLALAR